LMGFVAAMASTTSQAALNVVSKRVMRSTGIRGAEAQRAMVSSDWCHSVSGPQMFECFVLFISHGFSYYLII
jgi:hypothetical protein